MATFGSPGLNTSGQTRDTSVRGSSGRGSFGSGDPWKGHMDIQKAAPIEKSAGVEKPLEAERSVEVEEKSDITFLGKTEMVDLIVGSERALFRVHKSFLCNKIPYFSKMFNSGFKEAEENSATFPEDLPESFDILIEWVYSGRIRHYENFKAGVDPSWNFLRFYSLAEKLCLGELTDRALEIFHNYERASNCTFNIPWAIEVYSITPKESGLRRYVIQTLVWRVYTKEDSDENSNSKFIDVMRENDEIFIDFMLGLRKACEGITHRSKMHLGFKMRIP